MAYSVKIEKFEGPLDLLLDLIKKQKLQITEISISHVADQFLEYVEENSDIDAENLSDFLVVAAKLLFIKSKALLPIAEIEEEEATESEADEEEDENNEPLTLDDKLEIIEEKISDLKNGLLKAKDKLAGLADEVEGMKLTQKAEIEIAKENREGTMKEFNAAIKPIKEQHKVALKALKDSQKENE